MVIKMTVVTEVVIMTSFSKNTLTTDQLSGQLFATLAMFFQAFTLHKPSLTFEAILQFKCLLLFTCVGNIPSSIGVHKYFGGRSGLN